MVYRQFARSNFGKVFFDFFQSDVQAFERGELGGDFGCEGADGVVFDVAEEVFDADFFGLFGLDEGRDVVEGFGCRRSVL